MKPQDIQDLKELIEFLKQYQVEEFDLDRGDLKIRLKFSQPESSSTSLSDLARLVATAPQTPIAASQGTASAAALSGPASSVVSAVQAEEEFHVVKSPIVGTYYGSPSAGALPFVAPGDRVEKGQVICIVEAMKLMNEIEADISGEIIKCFVTNGQPIEFGQPLFSMRNG